ncbi:MAG: right-handed parallel beta-helix repeat-containing protein [Thermoplasmata archaeon]|nr:MAG: right-handed parallel beta-helix repeat-containing protein [Thermoplasmata archaeon]
MKRKIISIVLCSILILSSFIILDFKFGFVEVVEGETLYVNTTGSNGAYTSIQDAINFSKDGDTVFVFNGTYYENVVINKTINLTGEDRDKTIINGSGNNDVVLVTKDWVNITGFTITGSGLNSIDAGIELNNVQNCKFFNNNVSNNYYGMHLYESNWNIITCNDVSSNNEVGIYLEKSNMSTISDNNISNNYYGIFPYYSKGHNISGNKVYLNEHGIFAIISDLNDIYLNTLYSNSYAIVLSTSNNNNVINNNISSIVEGLYLYRSQRNLIENNTMIYNGIFIAGYIPEDWNTHIINTTNTINDKPIYYWKNKVGGTVPKGAGEIILANCTNIVVDNQNVSDGSVGIELGFSSNNTITEVNSSNNEYGMYIFRSNLNLIDNSTFSSNNEVGIYLEYSHYNNFTENNISDNGGSGILIYVSRGNTIANITASSNYLAGIYLLEFSNGNILTNNIVSDNGYGIYLTSENNYIAYNMAFSNYRSGIGLTSNNNVISYNTAFDNYDGISLSSSKYNTINNNTAFSNTMYGIHLYYSAYNTLINNTAHSNDFNGLYLFDSFLNLIINNTAYQNNDNGIHLRSSFNNDLTGNTAYSNSQYGIHLDYSYYTTIVNNTVSNNMYGIYLIDSGDDRIYHNNIIDNTFQAYDTGDDEDTNIWWHNYPYGGNYWSDYIGDDDYKGSNQNIPGSDGIGDTPYVIDSNTKDNYPLMESCRSLDNYTILKQGWNLISIPLIQKEQNLTRVLGSIDGWYDAAQWFDPTAPRDSWKHHKVGKTFGNDLFELNETMGFWIHITNPGDTIFLYNGTQPTQNQTISLSKGWNLVGYPSQTSYNRIEGLNKLTFGSHVDAIWSYNASSQEWIEMGDSDYFIIGKGYYIHAKTECVWEVPL